MAAQGINFLSPEFQAEETGIERRRRLAYALLKEGMGPAEKGQMVGRFYVPSSPLDGLAKAFQAYAGRKGLEKADAESRDVVKRAGASRASAIAEALGMAQGSPGRAENTAVEGTGSFDMGGAAGPQITGAQAPNPLGAYGRLAASGDPMAMQAGGQMLGYQQALATREQARQQAEALQANLLADRKEGRTQQEQVRRDLAADSDRRSREMQEAGFAQQRSMAQLAAGLRQPPQPQAPVAVMGPDGKSMYVSPQQAVGRQPAGGGKGGGMTATAQKELIETEEQIQGGQSAIDLFKQARAINDKAMGGFGAGAIATAGTILPDALRPATVDATQNLDNILQTAALPQLKAIFGGMPTEGERKILLDVQGSSSKPANVRKDIFDRAEKAIQARIKFAGEKAKRLREGTYFSGEGLPSVNQLSSEDQQALEWATANPNDPRAAAIKQKLGR